MLNEPPADEYERQRAERREWASGLIRHLAAWWLTFHLLAVAILCIGPFTTRRNAAAAIGLAIIWGLLAAPALAVMAVTLRNWSVLSWGAICIGLGPWAVLIAEVTLPLLLFFA